MRFKKLKLSVGITIIIFILIIGNIMVFGLMAVPPKNAQLTVLPSVSANSDSNSQTPSPTVQAQQQAVAQQTPEIIQNPPAPIIQTFRTRAS